MKVAKCDWVRIESYHRFAVLNVASKTIIECHRNRVRCADAADRCNNHELRNGRPAVYGVEPLENLEIVE